MLTGRQVRATLGIGKNKFLELVQTGELAAIKTGDAPNSHYRVSEESLKAYIERNWVRPEGQAAGAVNR